MKVNKASVPFAARLSPKEQLPTWMLKAFSVKTTGLSTTFTPNEGFTCKRIIDESVRKYVDVPGTNKKARLTVYKYLVTELGRGHTVLQVSQIEGQYATLDWRKPRKGNAPPVPAAPPVPEAPVVETIEDDYPLPPPPSDEFESTIYVAPEVELAEAQCREADADISDPLGEEDPFAVTPDATPVLASKRVQDKVTKTKTCAECRRKRLAKYYTHSEKTCDDCMLKAPAAIMN